MNIQQVSKSGTPRHRRRGALAFCSGTRFRWITLATLLGSKLPVVVAFALAAFNLGSDHEVRFDYGAQHLEVTLHHPSHGHAALPHHQHNLLERALIGKAGSDDEPDHHFGVAHSSTIAEEEKLRPYLLDKPSCLWGFVGCHSFPCTSAVESACILDVPVDSCPVQTPHSLRRGVMMRV